MPKVRSECRALAAWPAEQLAMLDLLVTFCIKAKGEKLKNGPKYLLPKFGILINALPYHCITSSKNSR